MGLFDDMDVPEEVRAKFAALADLGDHLHSMDLTVTELSLLGIALDLLLESLPDQLRKATPESMPMVVRLAADAAGLAQRLTAVVSAEVATVLGADS